MRHANLIDTTFSRDELFLRAQHVHERALVHPVIARLDPTDVPNGTQQRPFARRYLLRAAGLLGVWCASLGPIAFGIMRCSFASLTHLPCPGCGMTRAAQLLLHGNVTASLRMNAMTVPLAVTQLLLVLTVVWITARDGTPLLLWKNRVARFTTYALVACLAVATCVWIARFFGALGGPVPVD
jgi:hypothetical protein